MGFYANYVLPSHDRHRNEESGYRSPARGVDSTRPRRCTGDWHWFWIEFGILFTPSSAAREPKQWLVGGIT